MEETESSSIEVCLCHSPADFSQTYVGSVKPLNGKSEVFFRVSADNLSDADKAWFDALLTRSPFGAVV